MLVEKILKLSEQKKGILSFINDIRDESDRTGMRAVIEIKKDGDANKILHWLDANEDTENDKKIALISVYLYIPILITSWSKFIYL